MKWLQSWWPPLVLLSSWWDELYVAFEEQQMIVFQFIYQVIYKYKRQKEFKHRAHRSWQYLHSRGGRPISPWKLCSLETPSPSILQGSWSAKSLIRITILIIRFRRGPSTGLDACGREEKTPLPVGFLGTPFQAKSIEQRNAHISLTKHLQHCMAELIDILYSSDIKKPFYDFTNFYIKRVC